MPQVCVVLAPGAEETETVAVADVLVRCGCQVQIAALAAAQVDGSRGIPLGSHCPLEEVDQTQIDCLYLPGGMGSAERCRDDARVQRLIAERLVAERLLAIICASPIALLPGDHARGRRLTSHPSVKDQLVGGGADWVDERVVQDGCLWTSQGPGTAIEFGLALGGALGDAETAAAVADAMRVAKVTRSS